LDTKAQSTSAPPVAAQDFASRLFGYDFFISFALGPPPRGSHGYAADLAHRLRERDLAVFFSEDEAAPGGELDDTLLKALRNSRALVVICNRGTLAEPRWIRKEVTEYRKHHPDRLIIPINVDGALQDPDYASDCQAWLQYDGKIWIDDSEQAVRTGIVSPAVVDRLLVAPRMTRAKQWLRRTVSAVSLVLLLLAASAGLFAWQSTISGAVAAYEQKRATSERLVGESVALLSRGGPGAEERAVLQLVAAHSLEVPSVALDTALVTAVNALAAVVKVADVGSPIQSLAFSPDGALIVMGGIGAPEGDRLQLLDADTLEAIASPVNRFDKGEASGAISVYRAAFSPVDSALLAWGGATPGNVSDGFDHRLNLWNLTDSTGWTAGGAYNGPIKDLAFSADGAWMATLARDGVVQVWSTADASPAGTPFELHDEPANALAVSATGSIAAGGLFSASLLRRAGDRWRRQDLELPDNPDGPPVPALHALAFSPGGERLAGGRQSGEILIWDTATARAVAWGPVKLPGRVASLSFSPDGRHLLAGAGGQLWLIDAQGGVPMAAILDDGADSIASAAFSPDGSRVVAGTAGGTLRLLDVLRPLQQAAASDHTGALRFSSDGSRIYAGADSKASGIGANWDRDRIDALYRRGHVESVNPGAYSKEGTIADQRLLGAAVSGDGSHYATAFGNGTIRVWDATSDAPVSHLMTGGPSKTTGLALSDDAAYVAAGVGDGVRVWQSLSGAATGTVRARLEDGSWPGPHGWADLLCSKLTRPLTPAEWQAWVSDDIPYRDGCAGR
jgi:WD40 repeat protein